MVSQLSAQTNVAAVNAAFDVFACMLTFDANAGACAKFAVPQLTSDNVRNAATAFNSYMAACCHHPDPNYAAQHFGINTPIQIKELPTKCVTTGSKGNVLWNMDDPSDLVSCSGSVQDNLYTACRASFGDQTAGKNVFIMVFNIPSNTCRAAALGGSGSILFMQDVSEDYLLRDLVHEMGHNIGISHANTSYVSASSNGNYGDNSDPMGRGDGTTCYNAVNSNYLGFSTSLVAPLTPSQQPKNVWMPFAVPALAKQNVFANHLIVASNDGESLAFLSFRDGVSVRGVSYDQTSTNNPMANVLGTPVVAFQTISVHYVHVDALHGTASTFPMSRSSYGTRMSLIVDTISKNSVWSSAPFFGSSAAYKWAPLAGPFAVSFDSYDAANNGAKVRLCFLNSESDDATKACKSPAAAAASGIEPFSLQLKNNLYKISWLAAELRAT